MELEKSTLFKKASEELAAANAQTLAQAVLLSTPDAQKELTVEQVTDDNEPTGGSSTNADGTLVKETV